MVCICQTHTRIHGVYAIRLSNTHELSNTRFAFRCSLFAFRCSLVAFRRSLFAFRVFFSFSPFAFRLSPFAAGGRAWRPKLAFGNSAVHIRLDFEC